MTTTAEKRNQQPEADSNQHEMRAQQEVSSRRLRTGLRHSYDPLGEVRVELLRMARHWQEAGAVHQAIAGYIDMMVRYAGMPAAAAAAEELLGMTAGLTQQGKVYTALDIFRKVERSC